MGVSLRPQWLSGSVLLAKKKEEEEDGCLSWTLVTRL